MSKKPLLFHFWNFVQMVYVVSENALYKQIFYSGAFLFNNQNFGGPRAKMRIMICPTLLPLDLMFIYTTERGLGNAILRAPLHLSNFLKYTFSAKMILYS